MTSRCRRDDVWIAPLWPMRPVSRNVRLTCASDTRCRRHPLRQSATDEPGADARDREDVEILEELLRARGHVRGNVAPQENGDVVALEDRFLGIAREADRVEQDVLTALDRRAPVDRQMH